MKYMVVSSLKTAWHVPPMPGNRFKQALKIITARQKTLTLEAILTTGSVGVRLLLR